MNSAPRRVRSGFTLVELLVVIGIIALLISILLPALSAARRQAAAVKCAAQLRDLGNAWGMYAIDNKGWWPVLKDDNYQVGFMTAPGDAFWWDFVSKYIAKGKKFGTSSTTAQEAADARNSVVWGCAAWTGYYSGALGEMNRNMPGYGMSFEPKITPHYPANNALTLPSAVNRARNGADSTGTYFKQSQWVRPSEKMLLADAKFYQVEQLILQTGTKLPGQDARLNFTYSTPALGGQNTLDVYRHGKPSPIEAGTTRFSMQGGKVAFNILYCDGHVSTVIDPVEGYRAVRQRFPN